VVTGPPTAAPELPLSRAALGRLAVEAGPAGLPLGTDPAGRWTGLRLLRPEATRITLVGSAWAARLLVFRLLALGARVALRAVEPQQWIALDALTGGAGRVWPVAPDQILDLPADDSGPLLHLYDLGPGAAPARAALGPWQTQLVLLGQLTATATVTLAESDLVLLQRLSEPEAVLAAATLGLPAEAAALIRSAPDDSVMVVSRGEQWPVRLAATSIEHQFFGPPAR
jgi:hypothetical protein